jgi:hypothetical protein
VPINALCPHCESRLTLQDDLLGKPMRCPICRDVFTVEPVPEPVSAATTPPPAEEAPRPAEKPGASRADAPAPRYRTGSITDFLQVLTTEAAPAPPTKPAPPPLPTDAPLLPVEKVFTDFEVVEDAPHPVQKVERKDDPEPAPNPRSNPGPAPAPEEPMVLEAVESPKEVVWSADIEAPAPPPRPVVLEVDETPHDEEARDKAEPGERDEEPERGEYSRPRSSRAGRGASVIRPRRKKKSRLAVLLALIVFILGIVGAGGYFLKRYYEGAPERLYAQAKEEYDKQNYEPARKLFEELAKEYPNSPRAGEARFFAELCALRVAVYSVAVRSDPAPAQKQLEKFLKAAEDPAFAEFVKPSKFRVDVFQTVVKLTEEVEGKARGTFNRDKPDDAEPWLDQAEALGATADRWRPEGLDRENVYKQMQDLRADIGAARARLAFLAEVRTLLAEPDDDRIVAAKNDAASRGYAGDPAFLELVGAAERRIAGRVDYRRFDPPVPPGRAPAAVAGAGLLFAPRTDPPAGRTAPPAGPTSVFFAQAGGVLYALDEADGRVLWATRAGLDADVPPLYVPRGEFNPELILVAENDGAHAGLTARLARDGAAYWHQDLPAACLGQPVQVGQRVYVPLKDRPVRAGEQAGDLGVVLEIEVANGHQIGRAALGRPLGGRAVRRPGTGQLFVPAESQGVYVFDVDRIGPDGERLDPACTGIILTGHAAGTLRGEPIVTPADGDTSGYLLLGIADGLESMKLRAFPLTAPDKPPAIAGDVPAPVALNGWSWFPPFCDAEKLAVVTDRGVLGLFGLRQSGNLDVPLFVLPPDPLVATTGNAPARGQVVYADEGSLWFIARGTLHHLRVGFDAEKGLKFVPTGTPVPLGEPTQATQVNARGDAALVVTQTSGAASCRATAIDLRTGTVRWQRQLGAVAQGDPIRIGDALLLMDQGGGLFQLDARPLGSATGAEWLIDEGWMVAPPFEYTDGPGHFLASADGASVYAVLAIRGERGLRLAVRHYKPEGPLKERVVDLPAPLAGNPAVAGGAVVVPLANGMLYRLILDSEKPLEAGPTWRGDRVAPPAVCHLAALNADELLATDGGRGLARWRWAADQDDFGKRGELTLGLRVGAPPLVLPGDGNRVLVADVRGNVTLWNADRFGPAAAPLRSWKTSEKGKVPPGALTTGPFLRRDGKGRTRVGYVIGGANLVWLSPDADGPLWVARLPKGEITIGRPQLAGSRVTVTGSAGTILTLDVETGEAVGELARLKASAAPAAATITVGGNIIAPISDGTILLQPLDVKAPEKLPLLFIPLPNVGPIPVPLVE